jgi:hypothetical protein
MMIFSDYNLNPTNTIKEGEISWQKSKYRTKNVGSREKEKNWVEKD